VGEALGVATGETAELLEAAETPFDDVTAPVVDCATALLGEAF
jgi:hypothetical protein